MVPEQCDMRDVVRFHTTPCHNTRRGIDGRRRVQLNAPKRSERNRSWCAPRPAHGCRRLPAVGLRVERLGRGLAVRAVVAADGEELATHRRQAELLAHRAHGGDAPPMC